MRALTAHQWTRWVGWASIGWSAGALLLFALPSENYAPLLVQFVPLMLGVALVKADARGRARGAGLVGSSS